MPGHDADKYVGLEGLGTLPRVLRPATVRCEVIHREPPGGRARPKAVPNIHTHFTVMEPSRTVEQRRPAERANTEYVLKPMEPARSGPPRPRNMADIKI